MWGNEPTVSSFLMSALDVVNDLFPSTGSFTTEEGRVGTQVWGWMIWRRDHSLAPVGNITFIPLLYKQCSSRYTKELTRLTYKPGGQKLQTFLVFVQYTTYCKHDAGYIVLSLLQNVCWLNIFSR